MHIEKFKATVAGITFAHIIRAKKENGEHRNYSNENVDTSKSHLNYRLDGETSPFKKYEEILQRNNVKVQKRKDLNTFCSVCITLPPDVKPEDEEKFFRIVFEFLKKRYAQYDNVIVAEVHKDEASRSHLHFSFVPLIQDKKHPNRLKVCAKEVITLEDLQTLHSDCSEYVAQALGYRVSILNDEAIENDKSNLDTVDMLKNLLKSNLTKKLSIEDYKKMKDLINNAIKLIEAHKEELQQNNDDVNKLIDDYNKLVDEYNDLDDEIVKLQKKRDDIKKEIFRIENEDFSIQHIRDNDYLEK